MFDVDPAVFAKVSADVISGVGISLLVAWGIGGIYLAMTKDKDNFIEQNNQKKK